MDTSNITYIKIKVKIFAGGSEHDEKKISSTFNGSNNGVCINSCTRKRATNS